ncbi:MAG: glycosyltransferase family 4 protein [Vicingaceae bacterium]
MTKKFWDIVYKPGNFWKKVFWTIWGHFLRVRDLFRLPFYDGVYIFLWVTPFGPPVFERLFASLNKNIIYDIDDMVFLGHVSDANKFILKLKGRSKMIYLMKKAKHVITCTPRLDKFVRQYNTNTTDISSTINTELYIPKSSYEEKSEYTLGWSGSHSTSKYLHLLDEVLKKVQKGYPIKLKVIGDKNFHIEGLKIEASDWNRETEVQELSKIDIGLYPLPNEPWVFGKSGLKALQYMALGIPTVATNIGANTRVIKEGVDGFLVNSDEEWVSCIVKLIENITLRERVGKAARRKVESTFSVKANEPTYLKILKEHI